MTAKNKLWLETPKNSHIIGKQRKEKITLSQELITKLKKTSQQQKVSIETIIYSAWGLLLNRYTRSDDIIYGATYITSSEKLVLAPIRSTVDNKKTIWHHLEEMQVILQENENHINNRKSTQDLFSYLIITVPETTFKKILDFASYPLALIFRKKPTLKLEFLYQDTQFSADDIIHLIDHFIVTLQEIARDPDQLAASYSILTAKEKKLLLHNWNQYRNNHIVFDKTKCIHDVFMAQAKKSPNHLAVSYNHASLNYHQLDETSNQLANFLLQKKIRTGDIIAVLMDRTPAIITTMLGVFKAGAVYLPINPNYPDEHIRYILEDSGTHLILTNHPRRIPQDFLYKTVVLDENFSVAKTISKQVPTIKTLSPHDPAYVIYTSGTMEQPKGVIVSHASLVNLAAWYKYCFAVTSADRASQFASQGFDTFFCETIPFLCTGASVHIIDDNTKLTPQLFLPWLEREKITICDLPTAYAQILFNLPWPEKLNLRVVKLGGENLVSYPTQKFSFDIWNTYGLTEATVESTYIKINPASQHLPPPIGKPIANSSVYVVDHHMQPVPIGTMGELMISGVNVALGYLNRPQLTRDKFIPNPFSEDQHSILYRTGDLVRWLDDGNLECIGRMAHHAKIKGYRVELGKIETTLSQYPDVNEVVVIEKELINGQKTLLAYLVPNLDKIRIPYQERCMITLDNARYIQVMTEDFSREGLAITGLTEAASIGQPVKINFKLPGTGVSQLLTGKMIWKNEQRAGIQFDLDEKQKLLLQKSVEYYLSTHNLMETLQSAAAKRSLSTALKAKMPDYLVPAVFTVLPHFPLTFNGKVDWKALPPPQDFEKLLEKKYAEPRTETEKLIAAMWCNILGLENVSITDSFFDLGGDSLSLAQLSANLLDKFNLSIPEKILFDLPFIPIIAEYIDSEGKQYTYQSYIQEEINHDAVLYDNLIPNKILSSSLKNPQGILLTGAAGFVGIYLLRELLLKTEAKIYCLISRGQFESVAERLNANIEHYQLSDEISLSNRRITLISGDLSLDQFGLPAEQYHNLAEKIDLIYHCAAKVNTMAAYTYLRASNVQGTMEIIKFALQKFDKPIHYISTLSAAYKLDEKGDLAEEFPDADASQLIGGYAISKWVAERLLTQIKNRGLPVSIYRPGYILGQSDTGTTNTNDALLLLTKGCIQLGFAPDWKEKLMILPVDFISQAIVGMSLQQLEKSGVFHLDHPHGMMWRDFIAWLNNYGYTIKLCSHTEWLQKLANIGADNALYPFLPHYLSQSDEPRDPEVSMTHAASVLKEIHLAFPEMSDQLLRNYMNYLCQIGFLPLPERIAKIV